MAVPAWCSCLRIAAKLQDVLANSAAQDFADWRFRKRVEEDHAAWHLICCQQGPGVRDHGGFCELGIAPHHAGEDRLAQARVPHRDRCPDTQGAQDIVASDHDLWPPNGGSGQGDAAPPSHAFDIPGRNEILDNAHDAVRQHQLRVPDFIADVCDDNVRYLDVAQNRLKRCSEGVEHDD